MKLNKIFVIISISLALISVIYCGREEQTRPEASQSGEDRSTVAFLVETAPARQAAISEYYDYAGTVRSHQDLTIIPEVAGRITRILREPGDQVQKGDLLFELNEVLYRAQFNQAAAQLESAKMSFEDARKNRQRMENLYDKEGVSKTRYEQAVNAYIIAENALKQARAAHDIARFNLESTRVTAPFAGVVTARNNQEGDYINPAMSRGVYTLENYRRIYVDVSVPLSEARNLTAGMPAEILLDSFNAGARVLSVNQKTDPRSSSVLLTLEAENPDRRIKPGRVVTVRVHYRQKESAVVVPATALLEGDVVFVVADQQARRREVSVGLVNDQEVEILSGIETGERIIVGGNFGLFDQAPVREKK